MNKMSSSLGLTVWYSVPQALNVFTAQVGKQLFILAAESGIQMNQHISADMGRVMSSKIPFVVDLIPIPDYLHGSRLKDVTTLTHARRHS